MIEYENYDKGLLTTAWFIDFSDRWFDLAASRSAVTALSRKNVNAYNKTIKHLEEAVAVFTDLKCGKQWKPWQAGVVLSTTTIMDLQKDHLAKMGHLYLLTGRLTQDCLENLFSCVRMNNPTPDAFQFRQALKIISVARYMRCPSSASYHEDEREFLVDFLADQTINSKDEDDDDTIAEQFSDVSDTPLNKAQESSLYHLAGYCIYSVKTRGTLCDVCVQAAIDPRRSMSSGSLQAITRMKEFSRGCLTYCSEAAFGLCRLAEILFRKFENCRKLCGSRLIPRLMKQASVLISECQIPNCHKLKDELLSKFFTVRLYKAARKESCKRMKKSNNVKEDGVLSSKSMAMRAIVKKLK